MTEEVAVVKAKKPAKKAAKKTAKKKAGKAAKTGVKKAKTAATATAKPKTTCSVEDVVKLMQRKGGATIQDFHEIGFWQPAIAAFKAAERRDLKPKKVKPEGGRTIYSCSK